MNERSPDELRVDPSGPEAKCPDGKLIKSCEFARFLVKSAKAYKPDRHLTAMDGTRRPNHLHFLRSKCMDCGHIGSVVLDMYGRKTIGIELSFRPELKNTTDEAEIFDTIDSR